MLRLRACIANVNDTGNWLKLIGRTVQEALKKQQQQRNTVERSAECD